MNKKNKKSLIKYLEEKNFLNVILSYDISKSLNIYGAGDIAENILKKSSLNESISNVRLYDTDPKKIGKFINGIEVKKPDEILNNDDNIYISVAQSYDEIHSYLIKLKVDKKRIISGLLL